MISYSYQQNTDSLIVTSIEFESDKKIGRLGESIFSSWCAAAELTSNRSLEEDRTGWDHLVEFPYIKTDLPRDKQLSPIECRIQVKSTQRRDRKWSIKASVLKRLIDYSYPSFFLFLEFTSGSEPVVENAFLVHVDKSLIERTLKAIRRNDIQKLPNALYDLKISVNYNKKHLLTANTGIAFRDAVLSYVKDGDVARYQKDKRNLVETIGYEENCFSLKFDASTEEIEKHLLARAIGEEGQPITVRNSVLFDNRFNLKNGSVEIERSTEAKVTIGVTVRDTCQIRIKESELSPSINFKGEFVSSADIYNIGKSKLFFRTSLFSLELGNVDNRGNINSKCHFTLERRVPLDDIIKMFRLFHQEYVGKDLIFEVELMNENRVLTFKLGVKHEFQDARDLADHLLVLKNFFGIDSCYLTTVDEMLQQRNRIQVLTDVLQNRVDGFKISFTEEDEELPEKIKTPFTTGVKIGGVIFGAVTLFHCTQVESNNYQVTRAQVLQPLVFKGNSPSSEKIQEIEKQAIAKLEVDPI